MNMLAFHPSEASRESENIKHITMAGNNFQQTQNIKQVSFLPKKEEKAYNKTILIKNIKKKSFKPIPKKIVSSRGQENSREKLLAKREETINYGNEADVS